MLKQENGQKIIFPFEPKEFSKGFFLQYQIYFFFPNQQVFLASKPYVFLHVKNLKITISANSYYQSLIDNRKAANKLGIF